MSIQGLFLCEGEAFHSSTEMFDLNICERTEQTTQRSRDQSRPALSAPRTLVIPSLPALVRRLCCDFGFDPVPQIKGFLSSEAPQRLASLIERIEDGRRRLENINTAITAGLLVRPITLRKKCLSFFLFLTYAKLCYMILKKK